MPSPATGFESRYLDERRVDGGAVEVHLRDGRVLRGRVEYFDRDMIKINDADGRGVFLRKADIRYVADVVSADDA